LRPIQFRVRVRQGGGAGRQATCQRRQQEKEMASSREKRTGGHGGIHIADNIFVGAQRMPQNLFADKPIHS
jgi:hypothetical protein